MASTRSQSRQAARRIVDDIRLDVRHTLRALRANPAFAVIAILTLAVGIGAATSIFSVLNATLLRPLPFRDPARLMSPMLRMPVQYGSGAIDMRWSYPKFQTFLSSQRVFQDVALHMADAPTLGGPDGAERETGELVGAHYFAILGLAPQRGRFFVDAEDRPSGGSRSVVLSDGLWRRRMGADPNAVGRTLEINNAVHHRRHRAAGVHRDDGFGEPVDAVHRGTRRELFAGRNCASVRGGRAACYRRLTNRGEGSDA
jgi:hypothetical protein